MVGKFDGKTWRTKQEYNLLRDLETFRDELIRRKAGDRRMLESVIRTIKQLQTRQLERWSCEPQAERKK